MDETITGWLDQLATSPPRSDAAKKTQFFEQAHRRKRLSERDGPCRLSVRGGANSDWRTGGGGETIDEEDISDGVQVRSFNRQPGQTQHIGGNRVAVAVSLDLFFF